VESIKSILSKTGEISDIPSASNAFLVSVDGGTLGNISLRDYIKSVGLRAEGMGDAWPLQVLLGMREREWTIDQQEVLDDIIKRTQNAMLEVILRQRENLAKQVSQMLWYYIDGIHFGKSEASLNEKDMFIECHIAFGAVETTFIKSMKTGRWWMLMPDGRYVPCSYSDFQQAGENEIPERWLRIQERN
jgi:hypothetical protein